MTCPKCRQEACVCREVMELYNPLPEQEAAASQGDICPECGSMDWMASRTCQSCHWIDEYARRAVRK